MTKTLQKSERAIKASAIGLNKKPLLALSLGALGVVYGDIGTSPLYTLQACLNAYSLQATPPHVLGVLSLIFWTILIVVTFKYVWFVLRADNDGEGGILALLALVLRASGPSSKARWILMTVGLLGASLFYGDGIITPAISVLSAVEGLKIATPVFEPYVIPITILVLTGLFLFQKQGTETVGIFFGPVMLLWFATLGVLGLLHIITQPTVLSALNPYTAIDFSKEHRFGTFVTLGGVILAVTGAEALYADIGHFGKQAIQKAWLYLVLPALLLNYFGQGALLLSTPSALKNPFYLMVPSAGLIPMVILATAATIIASQAVISGAFSLTRQAIQLGYIPRMTIVHTSADERGQVYLPWINWVLLVAVIGLVLSFRESTNLAAAYGIAVTGTMLATTVLMYFVAHQLWGWGVVKALALTSLFFIIDATFFSANTLKIVQGGWVPLAIGLIVFTLLSTWHTGRVILYKKMQPDTLSLEGFLKSISPESPLRVAGTAVFMTANQTGVPHALLHNLKHNKVLHERVVIFTVLVKDVPWVLPDDRVTVHRYNYNFFRITAYSGFMETPDIPKLLKDCEHGMLCFELMETSFFVNRARVISIPGRGMAQWRERLFGAMIKTSANATDFFRIPADRVIELGSRVEI